DPFRSFSWQCGRERKSGLTATLFGLTLVLCLAFPPVSSCSTAKDESGIAVTQLRTGDLYALVVGVSRYRDGKVPKLELSDKDAKAFGEFLETQKRGLQRHSS